MIILVVLILLIILLLNTKEQYASVGILNNRYSTGLNNYSRCPYIPNKVNQVSKHGTKYYQSLRDLQSKRKVRIDNPMYNFF